MGIRCSLLAGTAFEGYITTDKVDITIRAINGTAFELPTSGSTELAVVQLIGAALIVLALIGFSATSFSSKLDQRAINGTAFELPTSGSTELAVVQLIGAALIVLALIGFSATSFSSKLDQAEEKKKHRK